MTTPQETIWEIEPHTKAKHEILRRYLGAWFPILSTHHGRIIYIDGFCGPGRYKDGEPGSPIVALNVAINHRQAMDKEIVFWFIDSRQDRIDHLEKELKNISVPGNFKVEVRCGEFQKELGKVFDYLDTNNLKLAPTFAFVDPFGFSEIPFTLIERLLRKPGCEVFITFMVDSINRFLEHPNPDVTQHIVNAFGTEEAICVAKMPGDRIKNLRTFYQKKLSGVAEFVRYFEMRNRDNRPIYYLFFASNHREGHIKMKDAMWRVDPEGDFAFSDATDPNQIALFDEIDKTPEVAEILMNEFKGRSNIRGQVIREFVENKTAYLYKHKTFALEKLETEGKIRVNPVKLDGKKRKASTYPDGTIITFV